MNPLSEVKSLLKDCGFKQLTFYPLQQQLAGYMSRGDTLHEILVDFRERKICLSAIRDWDVLEYDVVEWQTIQQACAGIMELAKKHGLIGEAGKG
ncbi:MAG: hypothetical protein QXD86_01635 [Candidatus Bathyarchaeia archaeon]